MRRWIAALILSLAVLAAASWTALHALETAFYRKALPAELGTVGFVDARSETSFLAMQLEDCGAIVFRLDAETRRRIEAEGLGFFAKATRGRGYPEDEEKGYHHYKPWRETGPDFDKETDSLTWIGLDCGFPESFANEIYDVTRQPGSYFSTKHEAVLVVIPRLDLIILSFMG